MSTRVGRGVAAEEMPVEVLNPAARSCRINASVGFADSKGASLAWGAKRNFVKTKERSCDYLKSGESGLLNAVNNSCVAFAVRRPVTLECLRLRTVEYRHCLALISHPIDQRMHIGACREMMHSPCPSALSMDKLPSPMKLTVLLMRSLSFGFTSLWMKELCICAVIVADISLGRWLAR